MTRLQVELRERVFDAMTRSGTSLPNLAARIGMSSKRLAGLLNSKTDCVPVKEWQDMFDAMGMRVDVKIVKKPKVRIDL